MRSKFGVMVLIIVLLGLPTLAGASIVYENTGWIIGDDEVVFDFTANKNPLTYKVTISDLSVGPAFGFDSLSASIWENTNELTSRSGAGILFFDAVFGSNYIAKISGVGGGQLDSGNVGIKVEAVPVPAPLLLLGSGLIGLVGLRKKCKQ